jgi:phage-related minor tail protein
MIPKSDDNKFRHEIAFDAMRDAINNVLEGVPEVKSIGVIIDWNIGKNELPFGMMIGRHGSIRSPDELFSMMEQTAKLSAFQAKIITEILVKIDMEAKRISEESKKVEAEASTLIKKLERLEKEIEVTKTQIEERNSDEKE